MSQHKDDNKDRFAKTLGGVVGRRLTYDELAGVTAEHELVAACDMHVAHVYLSYSPCSLFPALALTVIARFSTVNRYV